MKYKIWLGSSVCIIWSSCLIGGLIIFIFDNETDFLIWGPSNTVFAGIKINTWSRWCMVMSYSIFSQISYSVVSSTLRPFISNVIRDYKTPIENKGSLIRAHYMVSVYTFYYWISSIFDVFLWITMQLQFILPAIIIDLLITYHFTNGYMCEREIHLLN
tara:strand:+ start:95 stop:571 length:477 start_codon:yes stop_codon:yes gene_type:complete